MTNLELVEDLKTKIDCTKTELNYFKTTLFKNEDYYKRRSFNDLFKYYKRFGVTEKQLIKVLDILCIGCYYCSVPEKIVFFNKGCLPGITRDLISIPSQNGSQNICDKYTSKYLLKLLNS